MTVIMFLLALLLPACGSEDSTGCYWDATTHGNGTGTSFVAISDDVVIYLGGVR